MSFNVLNRRVHYWASFIISIPLLIMILTGVLLQVKKQWTWVQPPELRGTGTAPAIGLAEILTSVKQVPGMHVSSWDDVNRIDVRPDRGLAKVWLQNGYEVQVDLGTGAVLQTAYRRSDLIETIHDGSFFGGDWTKLGLFLPTGVTLLLLWLGGMWMWWVPYGAKRRIRRKRAKASQIRAAVLLALAATALACRPAPATDTPAPATPDSAVIVPLVGNWSVSTGGEGTVVTGDATQWDGQPRPDALSAGARLFGVTPPASFEANVTAPGAFPIAVDPSIGTFTGGTLSVDFKLVDGESDQIAGLAFDIRPTGEYLYVRYNTRDDNVALWRFAGGERARIADGTDHRRLPLDTWHSLTMTLDGTSLSATAAGDLRLRYTLDSPVDGRVGYWTKRDSITSFRNLRVQ